MKQLRICDRMIIVPRITGYVWLFRLRPLALVAATLKVRNIRFRGQAVVRRSVKVNKKNNTKVKNTPSHDIFPTTNRICFFLYTPPLALVAATLKLRLSDSGSANKKQYYS